MTGTNRTKVGYVKTNSLTDFRLDSGSFYGTADSDAQTKIYYGEVAEANAESSSRYKPLPALSSESGGNQSKKTGIQDYQSQQYTNAVNYYKNNPTGATVMAGASGVANAFIFGLINNNFVAGSNPSLKENSKVSDTRMSEHPVAASVGEIIGSLPYMAVGAGESEITDIATGSGSKQVGNTTELEVASPSFVDKSGKISWPDNMGFEGDPQLTSLSKGQIIDRYGDESGSFSSPKGTPYGQRSLPYIQNKNAYHSYEVIKPIDNIQSGKIAAAFNQSGGGIQYLLPDGIENLI